MIEKGDAGATVALVMIFVFSDGCFSFLMFLMMVDSLRPVAYLHAVICVAIPWINNLFYDVFILVLNSSRVVLLVAFVNNSHFLYDAVVALWFFPVCVVKLHF